MLFDLSFWESVVVFVVMTQVVIMLVTVYFHRACSHLSVTLAPSVHRVCRFLSWFLIAMDPQEFAAVHRKHHAKCDTKEDPHSPANHGWHGVLFGGLGLYRREAENPETIEKYGKGLPQDPWEGFYRRHKNLGILLQAVLWVGLFGWSGLLMWMGMMLWIPFWAAGVINGLGHHVGYRSFQTDDLSTNLSPLAIWVGGEELHNNHHAYPTRAKFSIKPWEFDLGWGMIVVLEKLGLAKPRPESDSVSPTLIFLRERHQILIEFQSIVTSSSMGDIKKYGFKKWSQISAWAARVEKLSSKRKEKLQAALSDPMLKKIYELEQDLLKFWSARGHLRPETLAAWKAQAQELSQSWSWPRLHDFCARLPDLPPKPALA